MAWWWWMLPGLAGVLGLLLLVRALGALGEKKPVSGLIGVGFGGALLAAAVAVVMAGLDVQTYSRLTYERPVATIDLTQRGPHDFDAALREADGQGGFGPAHAYELYGDEWRIEARVLKWKPWANVLGLDAQYRLDRLSGRYHSIEQEINATRSVHPLTGGDAGPDWLPWRLSAWDTARKYRKYVDAVDTLYGGGAYMPMADGAKYEVWITQSGLVARPANDAARNASAGGWTEVE